MPSLRRAALASAAAAAASLAACGGGGSAAPVMAASSPATTTYSNSVVLGASAPQSIVYRPSSGPTQATVAVDAPSTLLPVGTTLVLAEHTEPDLRGLRVICVSGRGETTNVVTGINLGVIAESAAILMDAQWLATDSVAAWNAAVASGGAWSGWENCGVKPEGPPSRSSRLVPTATGGYTEDVFDGNPGTNFNAILRNVTPADVASMLSTQGLLTSDDPQRPLQLTLRAYRDGAGHVVFIESGAPAPGAAPSVRGFVALYVPGG